MLSHASKMGSLPCNGVLLRQLREQRGLTQAELAHRAGFSDRLIVKAESGKSLAADTLQVLAMTLTESGSPPVTCDDLTTHPLAQARRYISAMYTCNSGAEFIQQIRDFLDRDVVFVISGNPTEIPFAGTWRGVDAIEKGFGCFFSLLESPPHHEFDEHYQYLVQGNDVVIWGKSYLHPRGEPLVQPMNVSNLLRFRAGKLYHLEDYYDTQLASRILNP